MPKSKVQSYQTIELDFTFPAPHEPGWKDKVERWYQLDAPAYGLAEFYWQNRTRLHHPDIIILASPRASNHTDWAFIKSGCASPAKFIHTLPSVRISSLCQIMDWSGPVICVQKDPDTIKTALTEALQWQKSGSNVWVLSVSQQSRNPIVQAFIFDAL